jgi:hypothetical protein
MGIKTLRVYVENSVIGGYFDDEFKEFTRKLIAKLLTNISDFYLFYFPSDRALR